MIKGVLVTVASARNIVPESDSSFGSSPNVKPSGRFEVICFAKAITLWSFMNWPSEVLLKSSDMLSRPLNEMNATQSSGAFAASFWVCEAAKAVVIPDKQSKMRDTDRNFVKNLGFDIICLLKKYKNHYLFIWLKHLRRWRLYQIQAKKQPLNVETSEFW